MRPSSEASRKAEAVGTSATKLWSWSRQRCVGEGQVGFASGAFWTRPPRASCLSSAGRSLPAPSSLPTACRPISSCQSLAPAIAGWSSGAAARTRTRCYRASTGWPRCSSDGSSAPTRVPSIASTSPTTSMSSRSGSTGARLGPAGCSSTGSSSKRSQLTPHRTGSW